MNKCIFGIKNWWERGKVDLKLYLKGTHLKSDLDTVMETINFKYFLSFFKGIRVEVGLPDYCEAKRVETVLAQFIELSEEKNYPIY